MIGSRLWAAAGRAVQAWRRRGLGASRVLGGAGEDAAARFLRGAGFRVLARNVVAPMGEADLVCEAPDRRTVVVVEVKTRRVRAGRRRSIPAEAAVHWRKRRTLIAIARHLARINGWRARPVRIDVIAVEFVWGSGTGAGPIIRHHVGAVA